MKVYGTNPETGEQFQTESDNVDREFVESMSFFGMTDAQIKRFIDNLDISADAKSILYTFSKATIKVGDFLIKIGKKIIDFICRVLNEFPSASFGMIFGAIVGFLIASIPVIGVVLGPLFTPIAIGLGLVGGLKEDIKDKALVRKISEINGKFSPLNA